MTVADIVAAVEVRIENEDELVPVDKLYELRDRLFAVVEEAFPNAQVTLLQAFDMEGWR